MAITNAIEDTRLTPASSKEEVRATSITNIETLGEIIEIAKVMAGSGFYPDAKTAQQAAALMIMGKQFGLTPAQSLTGIHIVKGKPMLHYSVILAKVRQHPFYDYRIKEHTATKCVIEFTYKDEPCGTSEFTADDAKRQGTQNMVAHPKTMLLARAASNGVKWYCPDVLNGMPVYVEGEMHDDGMVETNVSITDKVKADLLAQKAATEDVIDVDPETGEVAEQQETLPID